jgi:transposase
MRVIQQHRTLDDPFVQDAVALLQRSDRPATEVAKSLGISKSTLWRWYTGLVTKKKKPKTILEVPAGITSEETHDAKIARLERENAGLRKRVTELETDKAILKKAAAFFAKESE